LFGALSVTHRRSTRAVADADQADLAKSRLEVAIASLILATTSV
jgi:hypothetical protein